MVIQGKKQKSSNPYSKSSEVKIRGNQVLIMIDHWAKRYCKKLVFATNFKKAMKRKLCGGKVKKKPAMVHFKWCNSEITNTKNVSQRKY